MGFFLLLGNSLTYPKGNMDIDKKLDNCATSALLLCSLSLSLSLSLALSLSLCGILIKKQHKKSSLPKKKKKNATLFQQVGEGDINARNYKALSLCNVLIMWKELQYLIFCIKCYFYLNP